MSRDIKLSPHASGDTYANSGLLKVTPELIDIVKRFASKLSKGVYYRETGRILPVEGEIAAHLFTSVELHLDRFVPALEALKELPGVVADHLRCGQSLNDQFTLKWAVGDSHKFFVLQAVFGESFGVVTFGADEPGLISETLRTLSKGTGEGPVTLMQPVNSGTAPEETK